MSHLAPWYRGRSSRGARDQNGQAVIESALVFPIFVVFIFGGFVIFLWNLYAASANYVAHEATQVPGQDPSLAITQSYTDAVIAARGSYLAGTTINLCWPQNVNDSPASNLTVSSDSGALVSAQYPASITVDGTLYPVTSCGGPGPHGHGHGHGHILYDCPTPATPGVAQQETYICVGLPCYNEGHGPHNPNCFNSDAANLPHQDVFDIDVQVNAWLASPVTLPIVGQQLPVYSIDDETVQGFQP